MSITGRTIAPIVLDAELLARADDTNVHVCTCDDDAADLATAVTALADCKVHAEGAGRYDMDAAAAAIATTLGTSAYVEQTGGGCATIYIGPGQGVGDAGMYPARDLHPILCVGPGSFGWGATSVGYTAETFIGPDYYRFGDATAYGAGLDATMPEHHADPIAWLVATAARLYPAAMALPSKQDTDAA